VHHPPAVTRRLLPLLVLVAIPLTLLGSTAVAAAASPDTVALRVSVIGAGQLWITGAVRWGRFLCGMTSPCSATIHVPRGRRFLFHEHPSNGWHLTRGWKAACHGSPAVTRNHVGTARSCWLRLNAPRSVHLTYVARYSGSFLNPWPLGTTDKLWLAPGTGTFELTVNSATINANAEVEAVADPNTGEPANGPPPAGDQYTLVNLSLSLNRAPLPAVLNQLEIKGAKKAAYQPNTCVPPSPDLGSLGTVPSDQTVTGNLCFTIASDDASKVLLRALNAYGDITTAFPVWFLLR
jgi:hypothetical protein